jgi:hypothetical protein
MGMPREASRIRLQLEWPCQLITEGSQVEGVLDVNILVPD